MLVKGALTFHSTTGDPFFYGPIDFLGGNWVDRLATVHDYVRSSEFIIHLLLIGSLAAFLLVVSPWQSLAVIIAIPLFFVILEFYPTFLLRLFGPDHFDVSQAVGHGIFVGSSIGPERWTSIGLAICATIIGLVLGRVQLQSIAPDTLANNNTRTLQSPFARIILVNKDMQSRKTSFAREAFVVALLGVTLTAILMPDLNAIAQFELHGTFSGHWDANNIVTWAGFVAQGKRPYLDFWYPYSGMWVFDLPLPWGPFLRALHSVVLFTTFAIALRRLLRGSTLAWLAIIVCIFILSETNILAAFERYLISVTIVLTYVAIDRNAQLPRSGRVWFWISSALAIWIEPTQLIYAAPGVVIALIDDELRLRPFVFARVALRATSDFLIPTVCLAGFLTILLWNGELPGFVETVVQLALSSIYALIPTSLESEVERFYRIDTIGAFAPYILLLVAAILVSAYRTSADRRLALAVICTATVGIMTLQKFLIRNIGTQLLLPTAIGSLLLLALLWRSPRGRVVAAVATGAIIAGLVLNPAIAAWSHRVLLGMPVRIASDYEIVLHEWSLLSEANRAAFSEARFTEFDEEIAISHKLSELGKRSIFVFGDMPILYLLLPGPTPFQVNNYSASPVRAQLQTRDWLNRMRPDAVVMDPTYFVFDDISITVRDPVIVDAVVRNYVPSEPVGRFYLLFPRAAGQKIPLAEWRKFLGSRIDYGYLLRNIERNAAPQCTPDASDDCLRYLQLTFDADRAERFTFSVDVGALSFQVSFMRSEGLKTYLVPVDRIWFWRAAEANGLTPHPQINQDGVHVTAIVSKAKKKYNLY